MADLGDIADSLVVLTDAALYPNGVSAGSPTGVNIRVYRGHPTAKVLDTDLRAGFAQQGGAYVLINAGAQVVHATVNARPGVGRTAKPYVFNDPVVQSAPAQTLTVTVSGTAVTIGGTIAAGLGVAICANTIAGGAAAGATDTLTTLAAAVAAALVTSGITATASGAVVSVPSATSLAANTFVQVQTSQEVKRQIQGYEITVYAPTRALRDLVGTTISSALSGIDRFTTVDGYEALLMQAPPIEYDNDRTDKELLFIRSLFWTVQYPTTQTATVATESIAVLQMQDPLGNTLVNIVET